MYEAVRITADGPTTVARFAATAAHYGFDGLVYVCPPELDRPDLTEIAAEYDLDLAYGVAFHATDRGGASRRITALRNRADVLAVTAETTALQRFLAEQERVDVLGWAGDGGAAIGESIARTAAANGVYLELGLGTVLRNGGNRRVEAIRALQRAGTVIEQYDVPAVISAAPTSHLALRSPRALAALVETIDLPPVLGKEGLANWGRIVERTRRARSDRYIEPDIRRSGNETNDR